MLRSLYPKAHRWYLSLPLLGSIADGFDDWLVSNGYTQLSRKGAISELRHVDAELRRRRIKEIPNLTRAVLHDCWRSLIQKYSHRAATGAKCADWLGPPFHANELQRSAFSNTWMKRASD